MAAGFAISIKLLDLVTGPMRQVNSAIAGLEKNVKATAREGGLLEVRDALTKIRREAGDLGEKLGTVFTPLEGLTAAGSLAGMAALAERFASTGAEVGRTSALLGVGTKDLQNWRGAMRLAGGSAEDATGLIANMGRQLYLAHHGLNPEVFRTAMQFGLDVSKGPTEFLRAVNANEKFQKLNSEEKRQFASKFGIDERTLWLLSQTTAEFNRYSAASERHGYLSEGQTRAAHELEFAYVGLKLSVESMGLAIGGQVGTWMTPMLTKWSEWLDEARKTPAIMSTVESGVNLLALAIGTTAVAAIGKLMFKVLAFNAVWYTSPIGRAIAILGALDAAGVVTLPIPHEGKTKEDEGLLNAPGPNPGSLGDKWQKSKGVWDFLFGGSGSGATGPRSALPPAAGPRQGNAVAPNDALNNFASMRARGGGWQSFDTPAAGIQATKALLERYGAGGTNTLGGIISKWAPPSENDTSTLIKRAEGWMGVKADQPLNLKDPETMRRLVSAMIANEHGGVLPKGAPQSVIDQALGGGAYGVPGAVMNYGSTGAMGAPGSNLVSIKTPSGKAYTVNAAAAPAFAGFVADLEATGYKINSIGGYSNRGKAGGGGLSEHAYGAAIDINPGANAFRSAGGDMPANVHDMAAKWGLIWGGDWKEPRDPMHFQYGGPRTPAASASGYAPAVPSAADLGDAGSGRAAQLGDSDTNHHVQVTFANAPEGMRSGLTRAEGPAEVSVRTEHAMPGI
jgi:hypothetical protein